MRHISTASTATRSGMFGFGTISFGEGETTTDAGSSFGLETVRHASLGSFQNERREMCGVRWLVLEA